MNTLEVVFAGFGGQGLLFAGKVLAYAGLIEDREVSWMPSYGPEMRGGTANCSVTLSDEAIGSPVIYNPSVLVAMNQPSFDSFLPKVKEGGLVIADTTMIQDVTEREGVTIVTIPATQIAEDNGLKGLANIVLLGKLFSLMPFCQEESLDKAIDKCVSAKRAHLAEKNKQALRLGMEA